MFAISSYASIESAGGILFFLAEDRYILKSLRQSIISVCSSGGLDLLLFGTEESDDALKEALSHAKELGFFSSKKVIILETGGDLFKKDGDKKKAMLEDYLKNPETSNLLIILCDSIDRKTKLYKDLSKQTAVFKEIPFPEKNELEKFVKECFSPIIPDSRVVSFFLQKGNADLFYITTEIEKLKNFALSKNLTNLSKNQAEEILTGISEDKIFAIVEMCVKGKTAAAISLYRTLKISESDQKINPIIIMLFMRHYKALLEGKIMIKESREREIFSFIQKNRLFYMDAELFKSLLRTTKNKTVIEALAQISRIELGMKGSIEIKMSDIGIQLEQFMVNYF